MIGIIVTIICLISGVFALIYGILTIAVKIQERRMNE
jgi:uncharacterized protein with PQ loop repeat